MTTNRLHIDPATGATVYTPPTREGWAAAFDEDHPIRWEPKDNGPYAWLTIDEAVRRLVNYGHEKERAHNLLLQGHQLDTPFAIYELVVDRDDLCTVCRMPSSDVHHQPDYRMDRTPYDIPGHLYSGKVTP